MPLRALIVVGGALAAAGVALAVDGGDERPAVVVVRAWSAGGVAEQATGTVVAAGRVLTVDHVLAGAARVEVEGGDGEVRRAMVVARRPALDLALLRAPGATGPPVRFADGAGDELEVLTTRDGVVRAQTAELRRRVLARLVEQRGRPRRPALELGVAVAAGDSGAPVVDGNGAVVGVVFARSTEREGTAYAVRGDGLVRFAR